MFENNYIQYLHNINNSEDYHEINKSYYDLQKEGFIIYDNIHNKEKWIQSEILSVIYPQISLSLNFDNHFEEIYKNSILRFDLIDNYLKSRDLRLNIINELSELYSFFMNEGKDNGVLHVLFVMSTNSINDLKNLKLIEKLLTFYYSHEEYENKTWIMEIKAYLETYYSEEECEHIIKKYID